MHITLTNIKSKGDSEIAAFVNDFLPRLRKFPGVKNVFHYNVNGAGDTTTAIIWENEESVKAYWNSELIKEVAEFTEKHNAKVTRESYPLTLVLT